LSSIHTFKVKPLHPAFQPPKQATDGSGGFDLYMPEAGEIPAGGQVQVGLGFASAIPSGHVALLMPRSGVGTKQTLELANTLGLIDTDYRGQWLATMRTKNGEPFSWEAGTRLLQLAIVPIPKMHLEVVEELDETVRGEGGHGSTGT
jgi:dUTP pyrophosphatase